jgi:predicted amidohydrolase
MAGSLLGCLNETAIRLATADRIHAELAQRFEVAIVAGSGPRVRADGRFVNTARLFGPDGSVGYQDKQMMTRFEREQWPIAPGEALRVFDVGFAKLGIAICYDIEFPLVARRLAEAGAEILLAPSMTEAKSGSHRVHVGARARALENQCFVVVAQTVGEAPWCAAANANSGLAAVYGPPDLGFPETGIVATGNRDEPMWLIADLDLDLITQVRQAGTVLNYADWDRQPIERPVEHVGIVRR